MRVQNHNILIKKVDFFLLLMRFMRIDAHQQIQAHGQPYFRWNLVSLTLKGALKVQEGGVHGELTPWQVGGINKKEDNLGWLTSGTWQVGDTNEKEDNLGWESLPLNHSRLTLCFDFCSTPLVCKFKIRSQNLNWLCVCVGGFKVNVMRANFQRTYIEYEVSPL